jgi:hypothetical protein
MDPLDAAATYYPQARLVGHVRWREPVDSSVEIPTR